VQAVCFTLIFPKVIEGFLFNANIFSLPFLNIKKAMIARLAHDRDCDIFAAGRLPESTAVFRAFSL
jgi:hypothetical protein